MTVGGINTQTPPPITTGSGETPAADNAKVDDLQMLMALLNADATTVLRESDGKAKAFAAPPGLNVAPPLEAPMSLSYDDVVLVVTEIQNKIANARMKGVTEDIKANDARRTKAHQEAIKKLSEAGEKLRAAEAHKTAGFWLNLAGKVAAVAGSLVLAAIGVGAAIATGGVATPLAVVACVGAAVAVADLALFAASEISQRCFGGPELSIGSLFEHVSVGLYKAMGLERLGYSEDVAKMAGRITAMTVQVLAAVALTAASIAATICTGGAAAPTVVVALATIVGAISGCVQGVIGITHGVTTVIGGVYESQAMHAQADKSEIDTLITKLQAALEQEQDRLKQLVQELEEGWQRALSIISSIASTRTQVVRNMV